MGQKKQNLQKNLNYLVMASPLSLTTIAKKAGVNKSTLHNYANGALPSSLKTIESLADFFKVLPEELIFGDLAKGRKRGQGLEGLEAEYCFEVRVKRLDKSDSGV